jgi:hypothetical protein
MLKCVGVTANVRGLRDVVKRLRAHVYSSGF